MSATYTVTENDGHTHTRYSARHTVQAYFWAVVLVPHGGKAQISYSASRQNAEKLLTSKRGKRYRDNSFVRDMGHNPGDLVYPDAAMYPVEAVIK